MLPHVATNTNYSALTLPVVSCYLHVLNEGEMYLDLVLEVTLDLVKVLITFRLSSKRLLQFI